MRFFVYWNLHDHLFTVMSPVTGKVRRHTESVGIRQAVFEVNVEERQRMLETGRKNLHAGIWGELVDDEPDDLETWRRVVYDPWVNETFVTQKDARPVKAASSVWVVVRDQVPYVYAEGITYIRS